ncbi:uncharacterized protein LOC132066388 [Lycium ferocissimum]|uniref:uncharacterized protein LOC132066388 n=1 Tax=Lycium ferocissimum TaxID=112874 RepID=UPI002814F47A|nr:uncharacterized protein LOC132066388 [Lycium ferocissimum]
MLPKVEAAQQLTDLRPISLCNVSSKILCKILNARLARFLPKIISNNQSSFIKGRMISENILLSQEIIRDIHKPKKGENVVMKLDMAKAYDRVAWPHLYKLMRRLRFSEGWSRRGYKGFYMAEHGPQINHLTFADDMIIFMSRHKKSIRLIMKTLATYEATSGQKINKTKSCFMVASGVPVWMKHRISRSIIQTDGRRSPQVDVRLRKMIEGGIGQVLRDVELLEEVESILHQQQLIVSHGVQEKAIWKATSSGSFSVASVWQ